jgi:hypothetical protein
VDEDIVTYCQNFETLIFELGLEYVSSESLCYDPEYDVCGKYDLIMMRNGKRTLVELKSGTAPMWLGIQLAAYERMVDVDDVLGVSLKERKVFGKSDDYHLNHAAWGNINDGTFDIGEWKRNKKRRHMERIL